MKELIHAIHDFYKSFSEKQFTYGEISPASEAMLSEWEKELEKPLPEDYREFLKLNTNEFYLAFNFQVLKTEQAFKNWKGNRALLKKGKFGPDWVAARKEEGSVNWEGGFIQELWWSPDWISFAVDGCGNALCIDLNPGPNGKYGQIISMEWQDGQGPFLNSIYEHFRDVLEKNLEFIRNGQYELEDYGEGIKWPQIDMWLKPKSGRRTDG